jgi:hypothetical protein
MNKRNIIAIICAVAMMITITITVFASEALAPDAETSEPVATFSEADIPSETTFPEPTEPEEVVIILDTVVVERVEPTTYDEANSLLDAATKRQETAQMVLDGLIELGYEPDHPAIVMAYAELENRTADVAYYQEKQTEWEEIHKWEVRASEYPVATQVWLYMKEEFGWSDTVCAGIIGNMMAECGGCWTQDLDWDVSSSSGYGMIQWLGGRKQQLFNIYGSSPSVEDQLNFMKDELYGTNGVTKQVTDSQLNKIMNAESPEDCAYAFACYFERCGEGHRWVRRDYARRAYDYFVG